MKCSYPVASPFASTASLRSCGKPVAVWTDTPTLNDETMQISLTPMALCLKHCIEVCVFKLSKRISKPYTDLELDILMRYGFIEDPNKKPEIEDTIEANFDDLKANALFSRKNELRRKSILSALSKK